MKIKDIKFFIRGKHDEDLLAQSQLMLRTDSVTEGILKSHLLIERALASKIESKLLRPEILADMQWSFSRLIALYVGLFDPPQERVLMLRAFNRLRNAIAHEFVDEAALVESSLPWGRDGESMTPAHRVRSIASLLLIELEAFRFGTFVSGPEPRNGEN
jgi:hypothetical protein